MKFKNFVVSFIIFFILISFGFFLLQLFKSKEINEKKVIASKLLATEALTIKNQIDRALSSAYAIGVIIKENNGHIYNFGSSSKALMEIFNGIDSLSIAPKTVVSEVFPVEEKKHLIGTDLLSINEKREDILKTIESKKLTLVGPYSLDTGGKELIGRYPVFVKNKKNEDVFWGLVNININFDKFIDSVGLDNLEKNEYAYELYRMENDKKVNILSLNLNKLKNPVNIDIRLYNATWYLSLSPYKGWISTKQLIIIYIIMIMLCLIISIFVFFVLIQPDLLKDRIRTVTYELNEKNKMLNQSEKLANFAKMTTAIAHEIRQPLNSIKILSDGALYWKEQNKSMSSRKMLNYFDSISKFVDRIEEIIKNLKLMISSPEKIVVEPCKINKIISEIVEIYKEKMTSHEIIIDLELDTNLQNFVISEKQFHQVIINLLDNAIHALDKTDKINKKIVIRTEEKEKYINIEFADNGTGISKDNIERIFDPFFSTYQDNDNMGMGLYVVRNILKAYHSDIEFFNNESGGATFKIILRRY